MKTNKLFLFLFTTLAIALTSCNDKRVDELLSKINDQEESILNQQKEINDQKNEISDLKKQLDEVNAAAKTIDGVKYVDLGLSVYWAVQNVGAKNVEDYGGYYAWGEYEEKEIYAEDYSDYKFYSVLDDTFTKYYDGDGKTQLEPADDVATVYYNSSKWRTPSSKEWNELAEKCTRKAMVINGIRGILVTGTNNNSMFLPCTGYKSNGAQVLDSYITDINGYYWCNDKLEKNDSEAYSVNVTIYTISSATDGTIKYGDEEIGPAGTDFRYYGQSVRAVCAKN